MTERNIEEKLKEYRPLLVKMSSSIFLDGYDFDDIYQELSMELVKALKRYDPNRSKATFKTYFIGYQRRWLTRKLKAQDALKRGKLINMLDSNLDYGNSNNDILDYLENDEMPPDILDKENTLHEVSVEFLKEHEYGKYVLGRYFDEMRLIDMAKEEDCSFQTISVRINSCLIDLRRFLETNEYI